MFPVHYVNTGWFHLGRATSGPVNHPYEPLTSRWTVFVRLAVTVTTAYPKPRTVPTESLDTVEAYCALQSIGRARTAGEGPRRLQPKRRRVHPTDEEATPLAERRRSVNDSWKEQRRQLSVSSTPNAVPEVECGKEERKKDE